jgi:hypothetical protein
MGKHFSGVKAALITAVAVTVASAVLLIAGCGDKPVLDQTLPGTTPGSTPSVGSNVEVFLLKGEAVAGVSRKVLKADATEALAQMLKGPTDAEATQGYTTAIPDGTRLLSYRVEGGKATVDFSSELKNYGGGSARVKGITDQITNTVTANDKSVTSVEITVAGVPAEESLQP